MFRNTKNYFENKNYIESMKYDERGSSANWKGDNTTPAMNSQNIQDLEQDRTAPANLMASMKKTFYSISKNLFSI